MRALLVGKKPPLLGYEYVESKPYDGVVIGSLTLAEVLCFNREEVLEALAQGLPVVLYTPGLPEAKGNRALGASLAARHRELKNWGVVFTDGAQRKVITAQQAKQMKQQGVMPPAGAVLTPLAKEILDG